MIRYSLCIGAALALGMASAEEKPFTVPSTAKSFWVETFQNSTLFDGSTWIKSSAKKYREQKVSIQEGPKLMGEFAKDKGLIMENKAQHYGFGAKLPEPFALDGSENKKSLIVQYEVKYRDGVNCAGTYLKLLRDTPSLDLENLDDKTPFTIMFGPDRCDKTNKVHFIFNHQNPLTKEYEEKHLEISPPAKTEDKLSHLYTLAVHDDNTFEVYADQVVIKKGGLLTHFKPSVNPPKEIDDPEDQRPNTYEETEFIPDPNAKKPEDWDENEPKTIPNLKITKPEDWDEETKGPWKRPMMTNPAYKGKWTPPMIENPDYVGEWEPRKIPNPEYYEDLHPARMDPIGAVALEVWSMATNIQIDNIWLGHDLQDAFDFARESWLPKQKAEELAIEMEPKPKPKERPSRNKKDESYTGMAKEYFNIGLDYAQKYPLVTGVGVVFVLLIIAFIRGLRQDWDAEFRHEQENQVPIVEEEIEKEGAEKDQDEPIEEEIFENIKLPELNNNVPVDTEGLRHRRPSTTQQA
ncbi:calnexin [Thraustotheca clavata]|uniref:Calnexin n=1 Tax=Thraustotheca clavata TaxID=74557 RepID=A0A1W0A4V0_9STRA|nr:calnexin [Thraustotheca clavata]